MQDNYKIAYWIRTDIQHFAHIRPIYDSLGGVILTKNPTIFNFLREKHPHLAEDLILVKNSTEAKKIMYRMGTKLVVYTGFQLIFWGYSIQVFHGASDKHYLLENKRILLYDLLLLPGRKHMDKITGAYYLKHPEKFKLVGYPKFDRLVSGTLKSTPLFNNGKPTILYAPTWITEGSGSKLNFSPHGESSLPLWGLSLIRAIAPKWNLIIKYHSRIYDSHASIYEAIDQCIEEMDAEENVKVVRDSDISEYMNQADLMISDISAVCYEWFHTNRPIVFANPSPEHYKPSQDGLSNTFAWQAGDVLYSEDDILPTIEANLTSDKYVEIRSKLLNHSFYKPDGHATERQVEEIVKLYKQVKNQSFFRMICHNLLLFIKDSIRNTRGRMQKG